MQPGLLDELKVVSGCVQRGTGMETFVPRKMHVQGSTWIGLKVYGEYLSIMSTRMQLRSVDLQLGATSLGILDPIRGVAVCVDMACSNTTCSLCYGGGSFCGAELNIDQEGRSYSLSGCPGLSRKLKDCEAVDLERFMLLRQEGTGWVLRVGPDADRKVRELSGLESEAEAAAECLPNETNNVLFTFKQLKQGMGSVSNKVLFEEMCTAVEHIRRPGPGPVVQDVMVLRDVDYCGSHYGCRVVLKWNSIVTVRVLPADVMPADEATFTMAKWKSFSSTADCRQACKAWMLCAEGGEFAVASENGRLVMIRMK